MLYRLRRETEVKQHSPDEAMSRQIQNQLRRALRLDSMNGPRSRGEAWKRHRPVGEQPRANGCAAQRPVLDVGRFGLASRLLAHQARMAIHRHRHSDQMVELRARLLAIRISIRVASAASAVRDNEFTHAFSMER